MTTFVAFLRGINVGGNKIIKMTELAALFTGLGYQNVSTYLQSGNVLFTTSDADPVKHEKAIEAAIQKQFGFEVRVMVKTQADLERVFNANPFADEIIESNRTLFVSFLFAPISDAADQQKLAALSSPNELIEPREWEVYSLLVRADFPKTQMSKNFIYKTLKIDSTVRNWNTLTNVIAKMAG